MEIQNIIGQWALDQDFLHGRMLFICGPRLLYVRTKDGREVDLVITKGEEPLILIECKRSEKTPSPNLRYFKDRLPVQVAFQVIETPGYLKQVDRGTFVLGLDRLLRILP